MAVIVGGAFKGLARKRPTRSIQGHGNFLNFKDGQGAATTFADQVAQTRRHLAESPNKGYAPDKSFRLVAQVPLSIYMEHEMRRPGAWEEPEFVRGILEEMPDCIVNPNTKTAKGLKAPGARR